MKLNKLNMDVANVVNGQGLEIIVFVLEEFYVPLTV
jgi:hypothetical protein